MRPIAMLDLIRRLLTQEAADGPDQEAPVEAAGRVCEKLRVHLSNRIGQEGFRTLLARALTLTTARFAHLGAVRVGADGALIGLRVASGQPGAAPDAGEGAAALVANLVGLLFTFIGESLTMRLLSAVWPETAWDDVTVWENEDL